MRVMTSGVHDPSADDPAAPPSPHRSDAVALAETLAITLETVAENMAHRAPALGGDPQAADVIADAFDRVAAIGEAIERIIARTGPAAVCRPRLQVIAGGAR